MGRTQPVVIDGIEYPSVKAAADQLGVTEKTIWNRRNSGTRVVNEFDLPGLQDEVEARGWKPAPPTEPEIAEAVGKFRGVEMPRPVPPEKVASWEQYRHRPRPDADYRPEHYLHPVSTFRVFAGRTILVLVIILYIILVAS